MGEATASPLSPQEPSKPGLESRAQVSSPSQSVSPIVFPGNAKGAAEGIKLTEEQSPSCRLIKVEENDSPGPKGAQFSPRDRPGNELNLQSFDTPGSPVEDA